MARTRNRILMVSPRYPTPPLRGDQMRLYFLAMALTEFAEVRVVAFGPEGTAFVDGFSVRGVSRRFGSRVLGNARHPDPRLPAQTRLFLDRRMKRAVDEELRSGPDAIHISLARMGPYLPPASPGGPHRHVDLMDAISANLDTRAELEGPGVSHALRAESALLREYEGVLIRNADSSSVVSDADNAALEPSRCAVVPNGVDLGVFPFSEPTEGRSEIVFFGNLGYFHNVQAAQHIAKEILPLVRTEEPAATLRLVGARPASAVEKLGQIDGVTVTGEVPAIEPELRRSAAAVLPLLSGSGMKNKVLEAFASGVPVVSNRLGMQGIAGAVDGHHFLGGETATDLASAAIRLLRDADLRVRLSDNALDFVKSSYSWRDRALELMELYRLPSS